MPDAVGDVCIDDLISSGGCEIVFERRKPVEVRGNGAAKPILVHERELDAHPELKELVRKLDVDQPPTVYLRTIYPTLFIPSDRSRYVRPTRVVESCRDCRRRE